MSNIKPHIQSFREFANKQNLEEREMTSDIFSVDAILIIVKSSERHKNDILSDIRAIEGITVINVVDHQNTSNKNYSYLKIKVDTSPLLKKSLPMNLMRIKRAVNKIPGVIKFDYASRPNRV